MLLIKYKTIPICPFPLAYHDWPFSIGYSQTEQWLKFPTNELTQVRHKSVIGDLPLCIMQRVTGKEKGSVLGTADICRMNFSLYPGNSICFDYRNLSVFSSAVISPLLRICICTFEIHSGQLRDKRCSLTWLITAITSV